MTIQWNTVGFSILQSACTGIARSDEHIQTGSSFDGHFDKWFERVSTKVRVDRQSIGGPGGCVRVGSGEITAGIRLGRRTDVATLGIADHNETRSASVPHDVAECDATFRTQFFKERRLRFHCGNERCDNVDDAAAEFFKSCCLNRSIGGASLFRGRDDGWWKLIESRVETNQSRSSCAANRGVQPLNVVRHGPGIVAVTKSLRQRH